MIRWDRWCRVSLSFSDPRSGAWSRDSGVEEVGHPLQTSWARNMVPDVHSFMTSLGNPPEIGGIPPSRQRWATYIRRSGSVPGFPATPFPFSLWKCIISANSTRRDQNKDLLLPSFFRTYENLFSCLPHLSTPSLFIYPCKVYLGAGRKKVGSVRFFP